MEKLTEPKRITSLTPLDDAYISNAANSTNQEYHFIDNLGTHVAAESSSSSSDPIAADNRGKKIEELQHQEFRDNSESSVSDLSNRNSDSDVEVEIEEIYRKGPHLNRLKEVTCRGDFMLKDLPPIHDLQIRVPEFECQKVGTVSSIVDEQVVVQAIPDTPALDLGTVLFLNAGKDTLGHIFDVFGKVKEPYYTVRFNSEEHARRRGVKEGVDVFCAPRTNYTSYVFLREMLKMKGSDASWENNQEPPIVNLDYSDDEEEKIARKKKNENKCNKDGKNPAEDDNEIEILEEISTLHRSRVSTYTETAGHCQIRSSSVIIRNRRFPNNRQILPYSGYIFPTSNSSFSSASTITLSDPHLHGSAFPVHPPGHPPVRTSTPANWFGGVRALRAARRESLHHPEIARKHSINPNTTPQHPNAPTQGTRTSLLPIPERMQPRRALLLPPPNTNHWAIGSNPRPLLPLPPMGCSSNAPYYLPSRELNRRILIHHPSQSPILASPGPDLPTQRPPSCAHKPVPLGPMACPSWATFGVSSPFSQVIHPSFSPTFVTRGSFPPPLPHSRHPGVFSEEIIPQTPTSPFARCPGAGSEPTL